MLVQTATRSTVPAEGLAVVFLGTKGGPPPAAGGTGISTAVVVDGATYLIDVGRSAVTQYVAAGLAFARLEAVFITHLHADHVADYFNLFLLAGNANPGFRDTIRTALPVIGPGPAGGLPPFHDDGDADTTAPHEPTPGIRALTDRCAEAFAYSTNVFVRNSGIRPTRSLADVREVDLSTTSASFENTSPRMRPLLVFEDERVRVTATLVSHGPVFPAFAFRVDSRYGSVTLSGDTSRSENLIELAQGTDMLVHEAINVDGFRGPAALAEHLLTGHVPIQHLGEVAQAAHARSLVVSHYGDLVNPVLDREQWTAWAQDGFDGDVHVATELDLVVVGTAATSTRSK